MSKLPGLHEFPFKNSVLKSLWLGLELPPHPRKWQHRFILPFQPKQMRLFSPFSESPWGDLFPFLPWEPGASANSDSWSEDQLRIPFSWKWFRKRWNHIIYYAKHFPPWKNKLWWSKVWSAKQVVLSRQPAHPRASQHIPGPAREGGQVALISNVFIFFQSGNTVQFWKFPNESRDWLGHVITRVYVGQHQLAQEIPRAPDGPGLGLRAKGEGTNTQVLHLLSAAVCFIFILSSTMDFCWKKVIWEKKFRSFYFLSHSHFSVEETEVHRREMTLLRSECYTHRPSDLRGQWHFLFYIVLPVADTAKEPPNFSLLLWTHNWITSQLWYDPRTRSWPISEFSISPSLV